MRTIGVVLPAVVVASLAAGCNAIFDIHGGLPWPDGCLGDDLMIDDLEDGDHFICETGGRQGAWFTVSDGTGTTLSPASGDTFAPKLITGGPGAGRYAACLTGAGFTDWGALMGFNFKVEGLEHKPYSASTAGGIRFWMKSNVPVAVDFPVAATMPRGTSAGTCVDDAQAINCNNHFQYLLPQPPPGEWAEYDVPFAALTQGARSDGRGNTLFGSVAWDPSVLVGVQFRMPLVETAPQLSFDVCVDDVRFYYCSDSDCRPTCTDMDAPVSCPAVPGRTPAGCWRAGTNCSSVPVLVNSFTGLWGSGPSDVWTVGGSDVEATGASLHWNSSAWSSVPAGTNPGLWDVWGSAPNDVWAVGDQGVAIRWNGSSWSAPEATHTTESFQSLWGSAPNDVWAVGHAGTIVHWDGTRWSPFESHTPHWLTSVSGSGWDDAWAVGVSEPPPVPVMLHWNGVEWSVVTSGAPEVLFGVWSNGRDDAWAVGWGVVHWDGSEWLPVSSPIDGAPDALIGVWSSGPDDVWAVGTRGLILHWDGRGWTKPASGTTEHLHGVWGSGANAVWAVGERGTILYWNGSVWSLVPGSAIQQ
jgi:hypothetical protein